MSNPKDYNCETCDHKYCGVDVTGSKGDAPYPKWKLDGYDDLWSCPLPMITDETNFFLKMHKHYKNGILLTSKHGSNLLDQPNKYLEAMEILG